MACSPVGWTTRHGKPGRPTKVNPIAAEDRIFRCAPSVGRVFTLTAAEWINGQAVAPIGLNGKYAPAGGGCRGLEPMEKDAVSGQGPGWLAVDLIVLNDVPRVGATAVHDANGP